MGRRRTFRKIKNVIEPRLRQPHFERSMFSGTCKWNSNSLTFWNVELAGRVHSNKGDRENKKKVFSIPRTPDSKTLLTKVKGYSFMYVSCAKERVDYALQTWLKSSFALVDERQLVDRQVHVICASNADNSSGKLTFVEFQHLGRDNMCRWKQIVPVNSKARINGPRRCLPYLYRALGPLW